jgi:hypothetical protein
VAGVTKRGGILERGREREGEGEREVDAQTQTQSLWSENRHWFPFIGISFV